MLIALRNKLRNDKKAGFYHATRVVKSPKSNVTPEALVGYDWKQSVWTQINDSEKYFSEQTLPNRNRNRFDKSLSLHKPINLLFQTPSLYKYIQ